MEPTWRDGNRIQLLPEGKRYIPALLEAIEGAYESILFEQYLMASGRFADKVIDALVTASQRDVQVLMILDAYGGKGLKSHDRERLTQAGVALREFNPPLSGWPGDMLARNHRKLLLVDRRVAFTGGFCVIDEFLGKWYDIVARVEGPIVKDWMDLFLRLWRSRATKGTASMLPSLAPSHSADRKTGGIPGRVIWGRGYRQQAIQRSLQQRIDTARQGVRLCTPYFLPTHSLKRNLIAAARRGVTVNLLVAGSNHDHPSIYHASRTHYGPLLRAGVNIYEYQPRFIHAKYAVVDDWITLGSCNFDHWSLRWNLEANLEAADPCIAEETSRLFDHDLQVGRKIDALAWARRPLRQRCMEYVTGGVSSFLMRLR